jgi:putative ABC transport system permease protein
MNTHSLSFSLYDLFFLGTVFAGLTIAILLWFTKSINVIANRFLALALVVMALWVVQVLAGDLKISEPLPLRFSLAVGPLIYFYVFKLTRSAAKLRLSYLLHFCPLIIEQGIWIFKMDAFLQWLTFISVLIYLYRCNSLIDRFYDNIKFNEGDRYRNELLWLRRLLTGFRMLWLLWIPYAAAAGFYHWNARTAYPLDLLFAVMLIRIGVAAILRPVKEASTNITLFAKPLTGAELKQKGTWLKKVVKAQRLYEDPDLSLGSLAKQLDMNAHELSRIINTALKKSFADFINEYRIHEVVRKMQDPAYDQYTLLGIAYDSGFNSKTNFNRVFRQLTGKSPGEYKYQLKKERPFYNTEPQLRTSPLILRYETTSVRSHVKLTHNHMLKSYLKIAVRNLQKQKGFAFINIFGLSTGIACFALLFLYSFHELNFDSFHKNADNIYRVYLHEGMPDADGINASTDYSAASGVTWGEAMKKDLPDVVDYVRLQLPWGENLIQTASKTLRAEVGFADQSLFSVFSFPLKYGSKKTALRGRHDIVLTASRAKQLFGTDDVVGKTVEIQLGTNNYPFTISAVAEDVPSNSTILFDVLASFEFINSYRPDYFDIGNNWHPVVRQTYVQLKPGSKLPVDTRQLERFMESYEPDFVSMSNNYVAMMKKQGVVWTGKGLPESLSLQPLLSIHTDTAFKAWGFSDYDKIDPTVIWIVLTIGAGILLIACINFTTLAIGRSAGRSKEVGVRKVVGAEKRQIITQFLAEALLLAAASAVLGLLLAMLLLPLFNQLTGTNLSFAFLQYPIVGLVLAGVVLIAGLLAGSYPALILSGFKPVEVLKNKVRIGGVNLFTKSLVTFQFVLSIVLIISTAIIFRQTKYLLNKNPGFNKANVVVLDASQLDPDKVFPVFKQEALKYHEVEGVTSAAAGLGAGQNFLGYSDPSNNNFADVNIIDPDYLKVLGMKLVAGENFQPGSYRDTLKQVIINETMMNAHGWNAQNAVGQMIKGFQGKTAVVIGVVKNFSYRPLSENVKNQVFVTSRNRGYSHIYLRISAGNPAPALADIQKAWHAAAPGIPMKYSFLDEDVNNYYGAEQKWTSIVGVAGGISIFLACLGLLGLATLAAANRTKEIGIRKVLGASVGSVVALLSKDFIRLIVLAFVIATPLAWYLMDKWLQGYAARIAISWWVFAFTGTGIILIAFISISSQSIKAATADPVKCLKSG